MSGKMNYLSVYVMSQIPHLVEFLRKFLPCEIEIKSLKLPGEFNRNLRLNIEDEEFIRDAEIIVADTSLLAKYYAKMPKLKWAHCSWAGVEPLMATLDPLKPSPSFLLTRHGGAKFSALMAEYVVCQILNFERNMSHCWSSQESKTWGRMERFATFRSLDDLTVGILGVGNMGCGVAKFLKSRGTKLLGFSRAPRAPGSKEYGFFDNIFTELSEILPLCDYVCNTLPSTKQTVGFLSIPVLQLCSKKPVFINVGRGNIIKEEVLVQALKEGYLSGAILDVFEKEPLSPSSELWSMPNVFITPHVAAVSKPEHIAEEFVKNYHLYMEGKEMNHLANWSAGY